MYVKNLAEDVDETALKASFDRFGTVESCCVIRDVSTNASRGFGFVKFQTVREAKSAIAAMHGAHVRGRALEVKFANADSTPGGTGPGANGVGTVSDNVYVKGLPPRWSERELRDFFKAFGAIVECRLLHASGTTTAGALIRFGTVEQAIAAVVHANNVVPTPGGVPLVMRFADSHGKSSRRSGKDSASNSRGGSISGGSGVEGFVEGFGALMAQHNAQHNAAMNAAMLQHQLMQQQMVSAGASLGASLGSSLGAMSASGSQHGGERAMRAAALSSPNAHGQGVIDEGSAHDGSLGGTFDGTHGSFNGLLSGGSGVSGVSGFAMMSPHDMGGAGGAGGWLGPSSPFGTSPAVSSARGANGGLGGLSAMFAGGADDSASAGGPRPSDPNGGESVVFGSSLQKSADSNARRAGSSGSLGARSHGSANSLGSRGSSVRGGNAFGRVYRQRRERAARRVGGVVGSLAVCENSLPRRLVRRRRHVGAVADARGRKRLRASRRREGVHSLGRRIVRPRGDPRDLRGGGSRHPGQARDPRAREDPESERTGRSSLGGARSSAHSARARRARRVSDGGGALSLPRLRAARRRGFRAEHFEHFD